MLPEGAGQFIAGVGYSEGSRQFEPSGALGPAPRYQKAEADGYLEYGLTPWLSLVLAPTLAHAYGSPATNAVTGSESSAFGGRLQLYGAPDRVVGVQVLVEPPIGDGPDHGGTSTDIRLTLGWSFVAGSWFGFVDVEPGGRLRTAPFPDEARLDATAGLRPTPQVLVLAQIFGSRALSGTPALPRQSYIKLQLSGVYDISARWSVQAGGFRTIAGRNIIRETGPLAALWYRF